MKKTTLFLALGLALAGATQMKAQVASPGDYTVNFNGLTALPEGWEAVETTVGFSYGFGTYEIGDGYARSDSGKGLYTYQETYAGYIVTAPVTGNVSFYVRARQTRKDCGVKVFRYGADGVGEEITDAAKSWTSSNTSTAWSQVSFKLATGTRLAFQLNNAAIDDFVAEKYTVSEGAALKVVDASGAEATAFDFGYAEAGATATFTMKNPGTEAVAVAVSATDGFSVDPASATIGAEENVELTVALNATAEGSVTITPAAASGLEPVVIAVKGVVRDASKMFIDFADNALPADWETVAIGQYANSYSWSFANGCAEYGGSSLSSRNYDQALVSALMVFDAAEQVVFKAKATDAEKAYLVVEYYDGAAWKATAETVAPTTEWAFYSVTIPAGTTRIRFNGTFFAIDDIYGGKLDTTPRPKLEVVDIANGETLSWGYSSLPAGTEKSIVISNPGTADLDVAFSATANYALSATEATIAAGETYTLTIGTPANDGPGVLTITPAAESGLDAYTINLTSSYKVPAAVMGLDKTTVAFGKVYADASETIAVANTGDADLVATIASDNEKFVVEPAQLTVAQGETGEFTITYKYAEGVYGQASATITVTSNDGSAKTITATANAKNPNVWSEDFEDGISARWTNDGWTISRKWSEENDVNRASAGGSKGYLITPRLKATEGEELTFNFISNNAALVAEWAADINAATWNAIGTYTEDQKITFKAPETGNYYLRFSGSGSYLDNFEGFHLDLPDHQVELTSVSLPATGQQLVDYTATVTLTEKVGKAEAVKATLYVAGEAVKTVETTISPDVATTIALTYAPQEAIESAEAYIAVEFTDWAAGNVETEKVTVAIAAVPSISETETLALEAGTYAYLNVNFSLKAGWNTIVLPFMVSNLRSVFGEGAEAYAFAGYDEEEGTKTFTFQQATGMAAATPYVVYAPEAKSVLTFTNVTVSDSYLNAEDIYTKRGNAIFQGTYAPIAAGEMTSLQAGLTADGHIKRAGSQSGIKALRAYFELDQEKVAGVKENTGDTGETGNEVKFQFVDGTTVIRSINGLEAAGQLFDLNGRQVQKAQKGIFIQNGKKVIK